MRPAAGHAVPVLTGYSLSDSEFRLFQELILKEAGIHLADTKRALLVGRLSKRLRELGLTTMREYYDFVIADPIVEKVRMIDALCTNETQFFREPQHFDFLKNKVIPKWQETFARGARTRQVRIWSAACSTGEEPYTLAMCALDRMPAQSGWSVQIIATDLSTKALAAAQAGVYNIDRSPHIPQPYLKEYMLKGFGSQEGKMMTQRQLQAMIEFRRMNIVDDPLPPEAPFDAIFCRNVLIYFQHATKLKVINRLLSALKPDGYLFLGHAETLSGLATETRTVMPTVYVKK